MPGRPPIPLHDGEVDLERREVRRGGEVVGLTPREADLVAYLAARPGVVVPQDELMRKVWRGERDSRAAYHVARRLRAKIERDPAQPRHLIAVAGAGLRFEPARSTGPALPPGPTALVAAVIPGAAALFERDPRAGAAAAGSLDAAVASVLGDGVVPVQLADDAAVVALTDVAAALAVAERLIAGADPGEVRFAVALCLGDPVPSKILGFRGEGVRRALCLARSGEPGQLVLAGEVARGVEGPVRSLGQRRVAGLRDPELLYARGVDPGAALPVPPTRFFGRQRELAGLVDRVAAGARLVTLVGPGGIGKTRLALQAAVDHRDRTGLPVVWCDLRPARTGGDVVAELATALGPAPGSVAATLAARGPLLLALDGVEGVADALADLVLAWLHAAPSLVVLATGREALEVDGEQIVRLGPLDGPDAANLFVARARAARADARLDPDVVGTLVTHLEGWPLAVELCASRIAEQSAEGLLSELSAHRDRFATARGRRRAHDGRHASLEGAIASSTDRLTADQRAVLGQAAVFRGGFDRDAATAVLSVPDAGSDGALDALSALCARSLVVVDEDDGGVRYHLLDTIREYAAANLPPGDAIARHAAYYVHLGEARRSEAGGGDASAIGWFGRERQNLVEVHARLRDTDPATAARALLALEPWWASRGPVELSLPQLDDAVAAAEASTDRALVALARRTRGYARLETGDIAGADDDLRVSLALAEAHGDPKLLGRVLAVVSHVRFAVDDLDGAESAAMRAIAAAEQAGDRQFAAMVEANRGVLAARQGRTVEAERFLRHAIAVDRELGSARDEAMAVANLGHLLVVLGRDDEASDVLEEGIALAERTGNPWFAPSAWTALGEIALAAGDLAGARARFGEALTRSVSMGGGGLEANARVGLALLHLVEGRPAEARAELDRSAAVPGNPPTMAAAIDGFRAACDAPDADARFAASLDAFARVGADPWLADAVSILREGAAGRSLPAVRGAEHAVVRIARRIVAGAAHRTASATET